ncbi:MAG: LysM peptidoglycan-binding domain-containing protein [Lachnospiraceae bacterium]|nr:LysM peptidoglycan-binding domain-containing protein [Lachnospiraceae bacterium]
MEERFCDGEAYQIKEGDTLYRISRKYRISLDRIMEANPYVDVYNLQPGEWICVPIERQRPLPIRQEPSGNVENKVPNNQNNMEENGIILEYVITGEDTLKQVLDKFDVSLEELLKYNGMNAIGLKRGTVLKIPGRTND